MAISQEALQDQRRSWGRVALSQATALAVTAVTLLALVIGYLAGARPYWWIAIVQQPLVIAAVCFLGGAFTVYLCRPRSNEWRQHAIRLGDRLNGRYLTPEERNYLAGLGAQFNVLPPGGDAAAEVEARAICRAIVEKLNGRCDDLTWRDINAFQIALLALKPITMVRQELPNLRSTFAEVVSPREYTAYAASAPINPAKAPEEMVRADAAFLLSEIQRYRTFVAMRERLRNDIARRAMVIPSAVFILLIVWYLLIRNSFAADGLSPVLWTTLALGASAGAFGAYVSIQQRLQNTYTDGDPVTNVTQLRYGVWPLYFAPLTGAIFAIVLFFIFAGRLVTGTVFPNMAIIGTTIKLEETITSAASQSRAQTVLPPTAAAVAASTANDSSKSTLENGKAPGTEAQQVDDWYRQFGRTAPASAFDFAKLLVWCFIAGFAERFVPNVLNRLVGQADPKDVKPALPAQGNSPEPGDIPHPEHSPAARAQPTPSPEPAPAKKPDAPHKPPEQTV